MPSLRYIELFASKDFTFFYRALSSVLSINLFTLVQLYAHCTLTALVQRVCTLCTLVHCVCSLCTLVQRVCSLCTLTALVQRVCTLCTLVQRVCSICTLVQHVRSLYPHGPCAACMHPMYPCALCTHSFTHCTLVQRVCIIMCTGLTQALCRRLMAVTDWKLESLHERIDAFCIRFWPALYTPPHTPITRMTMQSCKSWSPLSAAQL